MTERDRDLVLKLAAYCAVNCEGEFQVRAMDLYCRMRIEEEDACR